MGERALRAVGLDCRRCGAAGARACRPRRTGVPAADRGGDHRASVRGAGAGPVSAAGRRPLLAGWPPTSTAPPRCWTRWPTSRPPEPPGHPPRWRSPARGRAPTCGCSSPPRFQRPPPGRSAAGCSARRSRVRGRMDLASYDRLFPSQDVLAVGGLGNLIAAPLARPRPPPTAPRSSSTWPRWSRTRTSGPTCPRVGRLTPEGGRPARGSARGGPGRGRGRPAPLPPTSTEIAVEPPAAVRATLGAAITVAGRRPATAAAGHAQARRLDAQPGLLRAAAAPGLHLGHPAVPPQLRRDPRRRPHPPPRAAGPARRADRPGRQPHRARPTTASPGNPTAVRVHRDARSRAAGRARRPRRPRPRRAGRPARRRQDRHRLRADRRPRDLHPRAGRPQGPGRPVAHPHRRAARASRPASAVADAARPPGSSTSPPCRPSPAPTTSRS